MWFLGLQVGTKWHRAPANGTNGTLPHGHVALHPACPSVKSKPGQGSPRSLRPQRSSTLGCRQAQVAAGCVQSRAPTARSRAAGAAHMRSEPACVLSACTRMHVHSAGLHTCLHTRWVFLSAYLHLSMRVLCSCARCLPVPLVPAPCARCPESCARWWGGEQCSTQKRGAEPPGSSELGFSL